MEDLFDSLIYIIITLVAFVISALGKKKKKRAPRYNPENQGETTEKKERPLFSNLEKLLNDELGVSEQEENYTNQFEQEVELKQEPEKIVEKERPLDSVATEMLDDEDDVPYSVEYDDTNEIFSKSIKDQDLAVEGSSDTVLEDFNLEDAVIYSEILDRKEYYK